MCGRVEGRSAPHLFAVQVPADLVRGPPAAQTCHRRDPPSPRSRSTRCSSGWRQGAPGPSHEPGVATQRVCHPLRPTRDPSRYKTLHHIELRTRVGSGHPDSRMPRRRHCSEPERPERVAVVGVAEPSLEVPLLEADRARIVRLGRLPRPEVVIRTSAPIRRSELERARGHDELIGRRWLRWRVCFPLGSRAVPSNSSAHTRTYPFSSGSTGTRSTPSITEREYRRSLMPPYRPALLPHVVHCVAACWRRLPAAPRPAPCRGTKVVGHGQASEAPRARGPGDPQGLRFRRPGHAQGTGPSGTRASRPATPRRSPARSRSARRGCRC